MDYISTKSTPRKFTTIVSLGGARLIRSTILATEIILGSVALPASLVGTAIASGGVIEKIETGLEAPDDLYNAFLQLPDDLMNAEQLFQILESDWDWSKVRALMGIGYREIQRIASDELENVRTVSQGLRNFREMKTETLSALVSVLCIYGIVIFLLRVMRLQDHDSLGDRMRKRTWRILSGGSEMEDMCRKIEQLWGVRIDSHDLNVVLQLGMEEFNKRRKDAKDE